MAAQAPEPAVAAVARRVRVRPEYEAEPATYRLAGHGVDELAPVKMVRIRSTHSVQEALIEFNNVTDRAVHAVWLDFSGNEVTYTVIEPRTKRKYRTFISHPWIVRDVKDGSRMMLGNSMVIVATAPEQKADITAPPPLLWQLSTHKFYPDTFKAAVRSLLLSHHRLQQGTPTSMVPSIVGLPSDPSYHLDTSPDMMMLHDPESLDSSSGMLLDCPDLGRWGLDVVYASTHDNALYHSNNTHSLPHSTTYSSLLSTSRLSSMPSSSQDLSSLQDDADMTHALSAMTAPSMSSSVPFMRTSYQCLPDMNEPLQHASHSMPAAFGIPATSSQVLTAHQAQQLLGASAAETGLAVPSSPRAIVRAARMLGWVVGKVAHVMKSPKRNMTHSTAPRSMTHPLQLLKDVPMLQHMERLPTHLVIRIIELAAPTDVKQCVTRGPQEAHPDIAPALLQSDPTTWPSLTPPQEVPPGQQPQQP